MKILRLNFIAKSNDLNNLYSKTVLSSSFGLFRLTFRYRSKIKFEQFQYLYSINSSFQLPLNYTLLVQTTFIGWN